MSAVDSGHSGADGVHDGNSARAAGDLRIDDGPEHIALEVGDLVTEFRTERGPVRAVDGVSLIVPRRGVFCVIGESGSGKSAMLRSIIGINPPRTRVTGAVKVGSTNLLDLPERDRRRFRGRDISMVFQDPLTALDPVYTIERQLAETVVRHQRGTSRKDARKRALELLELVQIPSARERMRAYPTQLSGGMRQRVVIAMAIAGRPRVLLADEPTTALDVTVQARMIRLFRQVQSEVDAGLVIVTHDLGVAAEIADDVAVMYAGKFVEQGAVAQVLGSPRHPYTEGLIEANVRAGQQGRPRAVAGAPPAPTRLPPGCAFAPRCGYAVPACWEGPAPVRVTGSGNAEHWSRCFLAEGSPKN